MVDRWHDGRQDWDVECIAASRRGRCEHVQEGRRHASRVGCWPMRSDGATQSDRCEFSLRVGTAFTRAQTLCATFKTSDVR